MATTHAWASAAVLKAVARVQLQCGHCSAAVGGALRCPKCRRESDAAAPLQPILIVWLTVAGMGEHDERQPLKLMVFDSHAEGLLGCTAAEYLRLCDKPRWSAARVSQVVASLLEGARFAVRAKRKAGCADPVVDAIKPEAPLQPLRGVLAAVAERGRAQSPAAAAGRSPARPSESAEILWDGEVPEASSSSLAEGGVFRYVEAPKQRARPRGGGAAAASGKGKRKAAD